MSFYIWAFVYAVQELVLVPEELLVPLVFLLFYLLVQLGHHLPDALWLHVVLWPHRILVSNEAFKTILSM